MCTDTPIERIERDEKGKEVIWWSVRTVCGKMESFESPTLQDCPTISITAAMIRPVRRNCKFCKQIKLLPQQRVRVPVFRLSMPYVKRIPQCAKLRKHPLAEAAPPFAFVRPNWAALAQRNP